MGTIMTNGLSQLPESLNADGNAAMNTLLQLAGAVGTAVISTIVASAQAAETKQPRPRHHDRQQARLLCAHAQRRNYSLLLAESFYLAKEASKIKLKK